MIAALTGYMLQMVNMVNSRRQSWSIQTKRSRRQMIRIDVLPDEVLLGIFDFYMMIMERYRVETKMAWKTLIHVCRRWRILVLTSPRRLDLRLVCTPKTPTRDILDIWPALPLIIANDRALSSDTDNVIAALGQNNRVCQVDLYVANLQLEEVLAAMQVPFPELTDLRLSSDDETPVIPDSFLDGFAPRLRRFELDSIPFPGLPTLLLSATHLVHLNLWNIPHSGYISPEAMAALLSVLSSLKILSLEFQSPESRPDWESQSLPPPKRSILPTLQEIHFEGVTEYLEDLVTFIDAPRLHGMHITFLVQFPVNFDCPRLAQFINCTPILKAIDEAYVEFLDGLAGVAVVPKVLPQEPEVLKMAIRCSEPELQLAFIAHICNSSLPPLSKATVKDLYITYDYSELVWENSTIDNILWLDLLFPFTAVKNLYLHNEFAPDIAAALQELVGARIAEVLPSLQNIFVEELEAEPSESFQEIIWRFACARQQSGHPITISDWDWGREYAYQ